MKSVTEYFEEIMCIPRKSGKEDIDRSFKGLEGIIFF